MAILKRGFSELITNVLLVLVVLVSVSIIALFLYPFLRSSTSDTSIVDKITTGLTIPLQSVFVNNTDKNVSFTVTRQAGEGTFIGILVILTDNFGQTRAYRNSEDISLGEFESMTFSFIHDLLGTIVRIDVIPIFLTSSGEEEISSVVTSIYLDPTTGIATGGDSLASNESSFSGGYSGCLDDKTSLLISSGSQVYPCSSTDGSSGGPIPYQCQDSLDNDGDSFVDLSDPDCSTAQDDSEAGSLPSTEPGVITQVTSITQHGVTWSFSTSVPSGQFANGDYWVIGPVTITSISPPNQTIGIANASGSVKNYMINGWEVNSVIGKTGLDQRITGFQSSSVPSLPYTAQPGTSIVKGISTDLTSSTCVNTERNCLDDASILTVLATAPANNGSSVFRPPYVGTSKPLYSTLSLRTDLLPSLPLVNVGEDISLNWVNTNFDGPYIDHLNPIHAQKMHPDRYMPAYGANVAIYTSKAALILSLDYPTDQKREPLIKYVQAGVDLYHIILEGNTWGWGGGQGLGRKLPITFAAVMLNNESMKQRISAWSAEPIGTGSQDRHPFHEDSQLYLSSLADNGLGEVLYGEPTSETELKYWTIVANIANEESEDTGAKTLKDPYGYIDGGHTPGSSYQLGVNSKPYKYAALPGYLIPEIKTVWNNQYFYDYVTRWVNNGTWAQPDPCAPYDGVRNSTSNITNYGITYGPRPGFPGTCIFDTNSSNGIGRFPERHGTSADGGGYTNTFSDVMWATYRYPSTCGNGILESPPETCDDGNTISGDNCSERCKVEGSIIAPGLVAAYTFDNNLADATGNEHDLLPLNSTTNYAFVPGRFGSALNLSGNSGDCLSVAHSWELGFSSNFTLAAWVNHRYSPSVTGYRSIIAKGRINNNPSNEQYYLSLYSAETPYLLVSNGTNPRLATHPSTPSLALGSWNYVVGTYNGTAVVMYVNGVRTSSTVAYPGFSNLNSISDPVNIGCEGVTSSSAPGATINAMIDELRIYNRALNASEVLALNNSYSGLPPPGTGLAVGDSVSSSASRGGMFVFLGVLFVLFIFFFLYRKKSSRRH